MTRVLVVEDEPSVSRMLDLGLAAKGFTVELANTGGLALALTARSHPDVVIVDLGLPDMDGLDVIAGVRGWNEVPIIVVSARWDEQQKVRALDAGADDYLTKPVGLGELAARIRAHTRSPAPPGSPNVLKVGDLELDFTTPAARRRGDTVHLTPIEWKLVDALVRNEGRAVTHTTLLRDVWGIDEPDKAHYVRFHLASVRRKLEADPASPRHFVTERGVGVSFRARRSAPDDPGGSSSAVARPLAHGASGSRQRASRGHKGPWLWCNSGVQCDR